MANPYAVILILASTVSAWAANAGGPAYNTSSSATSTGITLTYTDSTGTIDYTWSAPPPRSSDSLGSLTITTNLTGSPEGEITLNPRIYAAGGTLGGSSSAIQSLGGANTLVITYMVGMRQAHVQITPFFDGKIASAAITSDYTPIAHLDMGNWPSNLSAQRIAVPYDSQVPLYFQSLGLFANAYWDWTSSNASYFWGTQAIYSADTAHVQNAVSEVMKIVVSPQIEDVFPVLHNPQSPYMQQMAGRMVIDISNQGFDQIASYLKRLGDNGVQNCAVIIHNWQHLGYDNALPDQFPANSQFGGDEGLDSATAAARNMGCLIALHESYADYYPNFPQFSPAAVLRDAHDNMELGWFNKATGIQSYATKGTMLQPNAATQSPEIHTRYGTTAGYIDVLSASTPWWHDDLDHSAPGAGKFATYRDATTALWSYERQTHGGPLFGEGKNHWFWSGLLDGVEAQFGGEGIPIQTGFKAPMFADFDLRTIHPLQVNYGMGLYERWAAPGQNMYTTASIDAYRMQEILYGHAPFLGDVLWSSVPRALLEQNLVSPVAARYGRQTATQVLYEQNGSWIDASTMLKSGSNDFSQPQVTYSNGDQFVGNSRSATLLWNNIQVPQYGWAAVGQGFLAYTAWRNGTIADYAQTPTSYYANARNQIDMAAAEYLAELQVESFQQTSPRNFQMQLGINVINGPATTDLKVFFHLVDAKGNIALSATELPASSALQWQTGQAVQVSPYNVHLPGIVPDGTYSVRGGVYSTATGGRLTLFGNSDGSLRYILGSLIVSHGGGTLTFIPTPIALPSSDPRMNASGSVVNFENIHTDGMVSINLVTAPQAGSMWAIRAYPSYRNVVTQVNGAAIPMPAQMTCDGGQTVVLYAVSGGFWQVDLQGQRSCHWPPVQQVQNRALLGYSNCVSARAQGTSTRSAYQMQSSPVEDSQREVCYQTGPRGPQPPVHRNQPEVQAKVDSYGAQLGSRPVALQARTGQGAAGHLMYAAKYRN